MSRIVPEKSLKLLSGHLMPKVGFGTWKIPEKEAFSAVYNAINAGYPLVDCAAIYGNEKSIGKAFNKAIKEDKSLERDHIFVTSKVWNTDHQSSEVKPALHRTLRDLQLDYLDLYLMHFPVSWPNRRKTEEDYPEDITDDFRGFQSDTTIQETWQAMEQLVDDGLVKSIGVSNFSASLIWELTKFAKKPVCVNQVEMHPFLAQRQLVDLCQSKDIQLTAYSSLGTPSYEHWAIYSKLPNLMETEEVMSIAHKHKKTPAQILLAWSVGARGCAVLPKTVHKERLTENLNIFDFELDEEDINLIDGFDRGMRFNDQGLLWGIPIY